MNRKSLVFDFKKNQNINILRTYFAYFIFLDTHKNCVLKKNSKKNLKANCYRLKLKIYDSF